MKLIHMEKKPVKVSKETKQTGDIRSRWMGVEPIVWTDRMLTALENGVKGGMWFSLIDKVYYKPNLYSSFKQVLANRGGAGVDHVTVKQFGKRIKENIGKLYESLKENNYVPQQVRRKYIPKAVGKEKRPLGIPTVRDRVVQTALRQVIEPIFEREFSENSYGFRSGRGCKDALREVDRLLKEGLTVVVDVDIERYFDSISHDRLMKEVGQRIADSRVLKLIQSFLNQGILEGMKEWCPKEGTPQGGVISPLLANIYLNPLDHALEKEGITMIRYADDCVIMCINEQEAFEAKRRIQIWMENMGLRLHPEKTRIVNMNQPGAYFEFLGYHFERGRRSRKIRRWPRQKSMQKLKDTIRRRTRRCNGLSLKEIIASVNPSLKGWFEYYKHSYKWTFINLDKWIRMRLRSILRKRSGRRGRGRGLDHNRWPNTFFAELGLFSLTTTYVTVRQSSLR